MIHRPRHRHRAVGRLGKSETIAATRQHRESSGRRAIEQEVSRVHPCHQFGELHIDLRELPDGDARQRCQHRDRGRRAIHERVWPARRRSRFVEAIGRHIQIVNQVVRVPGDEHRPVKRLRLQREGVGRARAGQAVGRGRAIDQQILEADPRHRLAEGDGDIGKSADGARCWDHVLNHRRWTSVK